MPSRQAPARAADAWRRAARTGGNRGAAAQTERIRTYLADDLRPGLTVEQAGERYVVLASAELYFLLTAEVGWTPGAHRTWLTELLTVELLGPGASPPRSLS